jgi:putative DNA primase/helicase
MKKKRNPYFDPRSDSGNAELFAVLYRDTVRFDHKQGRWLLWDEGRWTEDKQEKVRAMMKRSARRRHELVFDLGDSEERTRQIKWALQSESRYAIDAALELAKSEANISDDGEKWDANPMLLGVANGIVDLATGQFRTATQADLITKFSPVTFGASAQCPRFEQFLEEIFDGDQERIRYIQKAIGYTLTGSVEEQCLFACFGSGRNGKSTLLEVLLYIMGDYGVDLPFGTLETKHQIGEGANLPGARFAKAVEIREGRRLDEARVKSWTGGDTISVRPLYRNAFSFSPTHKLWLAFNHKPVVADNSPAIWNRIHLIPFERNFAKEGADKKLLATLKAESPGILNWAIEGCLKWQSEGLRVPTAVEQATRDYEQESDPIGPFLAECCEQQPEFQVAKSDLLKAYLAWCPEPVSQKAFAEKIRSRGFGERRTGSTRLWAGLRLRASDSSDSSDTNFHNFSSRKSFIEIPKNVSRPVIVSQLEASGD